MLGAWGRWGVGGGRCRLYLPGRLVRRSLVPGVVLVLVGAAAAVELDDEFKAGCGEGEGPGGTRMVRVAEGESASASSSSSVWGTIRPVFLWVPELWPAYVRPPFAAAAVGVGGLACAALVPFRGAPLPWRGMANGLAGGAREGRGEEKGKAASTPSWSQAAQQVQVDARLFPAIVKLLDTIIQSLNQMRTLSVVDDSPDLASAVDARIAFTKARR